MYSAKNELPSEGMPGRLKCMHSLEAWKSSHEIVEVDSKHLALKNRFFGLPVKGNEEFFFFFFCWIVGGGSRSRFRFSRKVSSCGVNPACGCSYLLCVAFVGREGLRGIGESTVPPNFLIWTRCLSVLDLFFIFWDALGYFQNSLRLSKKRPRTCSGKKKNEENLQKSIGMSKKLSVFNPTHGVLRVLPPVAEGHRGGGGKAEEEVSSCLLQSPRVLK